MFSEKMEQEVARLVDEEMDLGMKTHGAFNSDHEACAVILEEIEEAKEALADIQCIYDGLWNAVKASDSSEHKKLLTTKILATSMGVAAQNLAMEAIQISAMCKKYTELLKGRAKDAE